MKEEKKPVIKLPKLISISYSEVERTLYALDEDGNVWILLQDTHRKRWEMFAKKDI